MTSDEKKTLLHTAMQEIVKMSLHMAMLQRAMARIHI